MCPGWVRRHAHSLSIDQSCLSIYDQKPPCPQSIREHSQTIKSVYHLSIRLSTTMCPGWVRRTPTHAHSLSIDQSCLSISQHVTFANARLKAAIDLSIHLFTVNLSINLSLNLSLHGRKLQSIYSRSKAVVTRVARIPRCPASPLG